MQLILLAICGILFFRYYHNFYICESWWRSFVDLCLISTTALLGSQLFETERLGMWFSVTWLISCCFLGYKLGLLASALHRMLKEKKQG